jgi:hypothetical protein
MRCPQDINDLYFQGVLSRSEIDCEPWDSNEPEPVPIDVKKEPTGQGDAGPLKLGDTWEDDIDPAADDQPQDKGPCPCQVQNPLLWLLAGVAIGYVIRK